MAPASALHLLDLPPDVLARIGAELPFTERLQLSLVCRRLRDFCAGPTGLWRYVDACICRGASAHAHTGHNGPAFQPCVPEFARWFTRRALGVKELRVEIAVRQGPPALRLNKSALAIPAALLHSGNKPQLPLPLRKFALCYEGNCMLSFSEGGLGPAEWLPSLQKVALFGVLLGLQAEAMKRWPSQFPPRLTDLSLVEGNAEGMLWPDRWLPLRCTALVLSDSHVTMLPPALLHMRHLRSLVVDHNRLRLKYEHFGTPTPDLDLLTQLPQLEELNLSSNPLGRPPPQLSALQRLRILYLHDIVGGEEAPPPDAWEPLRACTSLAFLSISANGLEQLPPAVADMAHLQALHSEENDLAALPAAPYLCNLRELLVDWRTLLASVASLRGATQLSRLILHRFQPSLAGVVPQPAQPSGAGKALLALLAALPRLRQVDDVYEEGNSTHLVTGEMAHVMWHLGQRCPQLQITQPGSTNLGWTLSCLVAELPHNAGTAMLNE